MECPTDTVRLITVSLLNGRDADLFILDRRHHDHTGGRSFLIGVQACRRGVGRGLFVTNFGRVRNVTSELSASVSYD